MFDRRSKPYQQNTFAAGAALLVMAGFFAAPALAATSAQIPCPDATEATLDVPVHVLVAEFVNQNVPAASITDDEAIAAIEITASYSLLAPRAEAAIRNAFDSSNAEVTGVAHTPPMAGTDAKSEPASHDDERAETDPVMNTRLPGISDDDFLRYKKQMYRRDI